SGQLTPELLERARTEPLEVFGKDLVEHAIFDLAGAPPCVELDSLPKPVEPDSIDALHYSIHITGLDTKLQTVNATTVVTVETLFPTDIISLDFAQLTALQVRVGSVTSFTQSDKKLHIQLPSTVPAGEQVEIEVTYEGSPTCGGGFNKGVVFDARGVHTFSQPSYARHWYPSHDVPWDKATATITIDHDATLKATAIGTLVSESKVDSTTNRGVWEMTDPVSTYLVAFYVGAFEKIVDDPVDGVPIEYFTYADILDKTRVDWVNTSEMMEFYNTFHPYPFDRYAMTVGVFGGGMEHQTNSLMGEILVRGDRSLEWVSAHEIAHQWWGDLVTLDSWQDMWLNEGFATYFDLLFFEHFYSKIIFNNRLLDFQNVYFFGDSLTVARGNPRNPVRHLPVDRLFSFLVYNKGAAILHMLRGLSVLNEVPDGVFSNEELETAIAIGDENFFNIFSLYAERHAYSTATSQDFQNAAEEVLGFDLDTFFEQWLDHPGHPELEVEWDQEPAGEGFISLNVAIEQVQVDAPLFSFPLHVRYKAAGQVQNEVRMIDGATTTWTVNLPDDAWGVSIDPENYLLEELTTQQSVPVQLLSFEARSEPSGNRVQWSYADGHDLLGFHVHRVRESESERKQLTTERLQTTEYLDPNPPQGRVNYWLQEFSRNGEATWHGPVSVLTKLPAIAPVLMASPNPASSATRIQYRLDETTAVRLQIHDLQGRVVREWQPGSQSAGSYTVNWDASDAAGRPVSSGIYFLHLKAGSNQITSKVLITR
ncbi:MAG: T9SS type A sorting domain-containing protein, partial [Candidatus Eisenbacteria bacterium]|nr:T9SS type A sorting domain-containing protein [Candidatus Eisenbacteria bacterium]